jgi:peptidoglycan/LPS O-acetylase OafA/YrhL
MALFTVLPLAIAVLTFTACFQRVVNNRLFLLSGGISFEIYLVHAFTLSLVEQNMVRVLLFILITFVLAWITHFVVGWVNKKIKL